MYLRVPLYKYKSAKSIIISFVTPKGDLNKYKFAINTRRHISLLSEFMINYDICYCYLLTINVYMHKTYVFH